MLATWLAVCYYDDDVLCHSRACHPEDRCIPNATMDYTTTAALLSFVLPFLSSGGNCSLYVATRQHEMQGKGAIAIC